VGVVPVIGTSGGITPIPAPGDSPIQQDSHYPPYSRESHAEATLAMWRWIAESGPDWLFGVTSSTEADYYDLQGPVPAILRMASEPPVLKTFEPTRLGEIRKEGEEPAHPAFVAPEIVEIVIPGAGDAASSPETPALAERPEALIIDGQAEPVGNAAPEWLSELVSADEYAGEEGIYEEMQPEKWEQAASDQSEDIPTWLAGVSLEPEAEVPPELLASGWLGEVEGCDGMELPPVPELLAEEDSEPVFDAGSPELPPWLNPDQVEYAGKAVPPEEDARESDWLESLDDLIEDLPEYDQPMAYQSDLTGGSLPSDRGEPPDALTAPPANVFAEAVQALAPALDPTILAVSGDQVPAWMLSPVDDTAPVEKTLHTASPALADGARPAPFEGEPASHWVVFAPEFNPEWFFDAGRRYWERFRPTVAAGWGFLTLLTGVERTAVSLLVTGENAARIEDQVRAIFPGVWLDTIVADTPEDLHAELAWRAQTGRRLG
jgi:hypothetical protein